MNELTGDVFILGKYCIIEIKQCFFCLGRGKRPDTDYFNHAVYKRCKHCNGTGFHHPRYVKEKR